MRKDIENQIYMMGGEMMNKSEIARRFGCSWKTVDKKINPSKYSKEKSKRTYISKLDPYKELILTKVDLYCCTAKSIYLLLKDKYGYEGSYSLVNKFVTKHKKEQVKKATIRYETIPGHQAQVDWKEKLKLVDSYGNEYIINIFLMILGYSRKKFIKLTFDKSQQTLFECMSQAFEFFGGTTKEFLFDNMKTVVDQAKSNYHSVVINERFRQFAKDANFNIVTCKAYRPQTKGKVENLAKIMNRLKAYNNEFGLIYDLYPIIENLNIELNNEIVQGLNQTPNERFEKEKSTLINVNLDLLEPYYIPTKEYKVSNESMITYKNKKYSVPTYLIGKNVTVKEGETTIYIYYTTNFICSYNTYESLRFNYKDSHYKDILKQDAFKDATDEELEAQIKKNLCSMDNINIERDEEI